MELKSIITKGTVPILLLEILRKREMYGYEIVKEVSRRSGGRLEFGQGTVYPLLYKLEEKKYVTSERRLAPSGKERRYYRITEKGADYLKASKAAWNEVSEAIGMVLGAESATYGPATA